MTPLPRHPHRFRLARAGIHQVWQYDDVFEFGGGRLLLRGKNGAGKSKALEMLLPFLLDGDTRKLDATGGGKTTLKWLMLDGWKQGTNRLGYLWVEFLRTTEEDETERVTLGVAVRASTSTGEAKPTFFVTRLAVGQEFPLDDPARRPSVAELRDLVGADNCFDRAADYRGRVARELFGLSDLTRYRNLVHLLYGLRRPTIGDRIESGGLVKVLSDALPPLDDEVIDKVARNLDDLDTVRSELAGLEETDAALTKFLDAYRGYLRGVLRGRAGQVEGGLAELRRRRKAAGDAERDVSRLKEEREAAENAVEAVETAREAADTDLRALRDSAAYGALEDLRERRLTVQAIENATGSAWSAAELSRTGEANAAARLSRETDEIGRDLTDLRSSVRDARRTARDCGLDDALIGEPPAARTDVLAPAGTRPVTDPAGDVREVAAPRAEAVEAAAGGALAGWTARLGEAETVVVARRRAAGSLRELLGEVSAAEGKAAGLRREAERLDGQLDGARHRRDERGGGLVAASAAYRAETAAWARRLPGPAPVLALVALPPADEDMPFEERSLDREVPAHVARVAHEVADPVLDALEAERDEAVTRERGIVAELEKAEEERAFWERQTDPEPARSPYSTAERETGSGAPLFLLIDFAASLSGPERAGLEAALEAGGLLNAWVCADGRVLAEDAREVALCSGAPVAGRSLADVLVPVPGHGVGRTVLDDLLRGIGLGDSPAHSRVATDGRWRLGVAHGAYRKDRPEYVGATVRAETRRRRVAELAARVLELRAALETARGAREEIEERRDLLRRALREVPTGRDLGRAWNDVENAVAEVSRLTVELTAARRDAEAALTTAVTLRTRAHAQATADGLPAERDALDRLHGLLGVLRKTLDALAREGRRVADRLGAHQDTRATWEETRRSRVGTETDYGTALATLTKARRELRFLEESAGATEQELIARERDAQRRFDAAIGELPRARNAYGTARDGLARAEGERDRLLRDLGEQERDVIEGGGALRRPLGLPGLPLAAGIGDVEPAVGAYDAAQDGDVRARVTALRALADDVGGRLGTASGDIGDSLVLRRGEELRDGLAGGYDAGIEEVDGIKRFALHDDSGTHDVAVVAARIRTAAAEARRQLSAREQEVFERYLLGELGDHLSRQVLASQTLVAAMNATLDEVRSSHGIGARLRWDLADGGDADVKAAVALLRHPSALRTRDQSQQLRDALRRRIEEARLADPSAGYAVHLRSALDYRAWFTFKVMVTDAANPERERVLSHRTALSQGEQRVVSYLVLFATAAAHFSSLGGSAPAAPRLILLDDAFAKVDEPTHGRLLGLLVELDLDFVVTSERLWGCFPTVPSLHIYECLRDPHVRGVATVHFTWDGRDKRLVGV